MNIAQIESQHDLLVDAMDSLMAEMNIQDRDGDGSISLEEFKRVYDSVSHSKWYPHHLQVLCFQEVNVQSEFLQIVMPFIEKKQMDVAKCLQMSEW